MAQLPALWENLEWNAGAEKHARYIVKTDTLQHSEDTSNPWYTPDGQAAAQSSNIAANSDAGATDRWAIDTWMAGPFHAVGVLDPALRQTGYGSYREGDGGFQMGAALDVIRGLSSATPESISFPIFWPGNGAVVPLRLYPGNESPQPLTSCPGYTAPSGLPIVVQLRKDSPLPAITASSFSRGGEALEHCRFDGTTYSNPNPNDQSTGRAVLSARNAVVLIPRQPLDPGATYNASLTAGGVTYTWSFTVSPDAAASSARTQGAIIR